MYFRIICVGWGLFKEPAAAAFVIYVYILYILVHIVRPSLPKTLDAPGMESGKATETR
jgi:divalent metal cation (Fe/Co/Zn/Cd) transporter